LWQVEEDKAVDFPSSVDLNQDVQEARPDSGPLVLDTDQCID
jgi:hypothetical protein